VRDNGIGLAQEQLGRIFELFAQVDNSLERARDGLGLGLTLVRKLLEMHDGTVEATSAGPGRGSEFVVRLPVLHDLQPAGSQEPKDADSKPPFPRRILVVDDNRDSAMSLAMLLRLLGHTVDTAHDGLEAVERAATFRADAILLDIGMPRLNGYEAARLIRQQQKNGLKLVALTGWGQEEDRRSSAQAGFDAHLVKPVDLAALTKLLADWARDGEPSATQNATRHPLSYASEP
jgi:CheY-like chemotaxis protein